MLHRDLRGATASLALALALPLALGACAAEIRLEDDDGTGDGETTAGGPNGDGDHDGPTSTSASASSGGPATEAEALAAACSAICQTRCIATSLYCERDCVDVIDECLAEKLAWVQCIMPGRTGPCPEEADPELCRDLFYDLRSCQNPLACGHEDELDTCSEATDASCDCTEQCNDGHRGRSVCSHSGFEQVCDCWFDDEPVGQCRVTSPSADCRSIGGGCCKQLFR